MKLSIVIPAYNEEGSIEETLLSLYEKLSLEQIDHEIVVVNDNSKDRTLEILTGLQSLIPSLVFYTNSGSEAVDTALKIAASAGISVEQLRALNLGTDWTRLKIGQAIKVR
mgnify:CR=1 FL=1